MREGSQDFSDPIARQEELKGLRETLMTEFDAIKDQYPSPEHYPLDVQRRIGMISKDLKQIDSELGSLGLDKAA